MSLDWIEIVKALGALAALSLVVLGVRRVNRDINELRRSLVGVERHLLHTWSLAESEIRKSLAGIEQRLLRMWFTAEKIGAARPEILPDVDCYETWDTSLVRGLLKGASRRIKILQTWFPEGEGDIDVWKLENLEELKVEIFMAHSDNPAVLERVRFRRDFSDDENEESLKAHIAKNVTACQKGLEGLFNQCKSESAKFSASIWLYKMGMPFGPIYIIDDYVIFGIYPPHINSTAAPMIKLPMTKGPAKLLEDAFRTMKNKAEKVYQI